MILDIKHKIGNYWVTFAAGAANVDVGEFIPIALTHNVDEIVKVKLTEISDGVHPIILEPENIYQEEVIFKPVCINSPGRYIMSAWVETPMHALIIKSINEFITPVRKFLYVNRFMIEQVDNVSTLISACITNMSLFTITSGIKLLINNEIILSDIIQWRVGESKILNTVINSIEGEHTANILIYDNNIAELDWKIIKEIIEQDRVVLEAVIVKEVDRD
jgi:hypothetical protein